MVYRNKTFANGVVVGLSSGKVELGADSGDLLIKSGGSTTTVRPGLGVVGHEAVTIVANKAALPLPPTGIGNGAMYFVSATNELFMQSGGGWYRITMVNTSPSITLNKTSATISENLTLDVSYTTVEPEGTPVTVSLANSGIADTNVATITHTTSNNNIRVVFDGTTNLTNATVTATVTDGVNTGVGTITINAQYLHKYAEREAMTLVANNPPGITDVKQQSLYLPNGDADYITIPASSDLQILGGAFTVEGWFYLTQVGLDQAHFFSKGTAPSPNQREYSFRFRRTDIGMYWSTTGGSGGADQVVKATLSSDLQANEWFHCAITMDSSNNVTFYLNGTSVGTGSFSGTYNTSLNGPVTIGRFMDYTGISHDFHGYISNLRIVKGSVVYSSNFTPPTSPLTAITNTVLLTAQGSLTDHSSVGHTLTAYGSAGYHPSSPFAPAGTTFDNKFVRDTSDSAHTLSYNGTIAQSHNSSFTPYRSNGYSAFISNGSANYVTYPQSSGFVFGTGDFTVEAWVFAENVGTGGVTDDQTIFGGFDTPSCLFFLTNTDSRPALWDSTTQATSSIKIPERKWTHVAWARSSGTLKIFVDGVQGYSGTYNTNFNQTFTMYTGRSNLDTSRNFSGHIMDLRVVKGTAVYTSAFTPPGRLTSITNTSLLAFNTPYNRDMSPNDHTITFNGSVHMSPTSPFERQMTNATYGGSFIINNAGAGNIETTDKASNEIQLGTSDFTIELWYNPFSVSSFWEAIISKRYAQTGGWRLYKDDGNGYLKWYRSSSNSITTTSAVLYDHTWTHIAVVRSGGTMKIYANGKEAGSASDTYNYTTSTMSEIEIGAGSITSELPAEGHIADVRIVVGTAVYTGNFTPPTKTLTKTGGTYPSTTNVNTSFPASHTKLLLNFSDVNIEDLTKSKTSELYGDVKSSLGVTKYSGFPTIHFDGNGDYIESYRRTAFGSFRTKDFTIETFFYKKASGQVVLFDTCTPGVSGSTSGRMAFMFTSSGGVERLGFYTPGTSVISSASGNISLNTWHHAVWTRTGSTLKLFLDGTEVHTRTFTDNLSLYQFHIGKDMASGGSSLFNGHLESTRIFLDDSIYPFLPEFKQLTTTNSVREGTTVTASNTKFIGVYDGSDADTVSGSESGNITVTAGSSASTSTFAPYSSGGSVYFNGDAGPATSMAYTSSGTDPWSFSSGEDFAVEYYVYHNATVGTSTEMRHAYGSANGAFALYKSTSNQFVLRRYGVGNLIEVANYTTYFTPYKWHHVCVQRVSGLISIFVNGTVIGTASGDTTTFPDSTFYLGSHNTVADNFNGYFSNLRFVKGQGIYSNSFTPPTYRMK